MKDAYSFDKDEQGLDISYSAMYDAYTKIFKRCGLDIVIADADSGAMGGSGSQEFMVVNDIGEDEIVVCSSCGYAANIEKAEAVTIKRNVNETLLEKELIHTPNAKTIDDLTSLFSCSSQQFAKSLVLIADSEPVMAVLRGDRELSLNKLASILGCSNLDMADELTIKNLTKADVGFASPVGIKCKVICDNELMNMVNFITGANKTDYHYKNVNLSDFSSYEFHDIRLVTDNDLCPKCNEPLKIVKTIEVGHIFKLGDKYSKALDCNYTDESGERKPMIMGCYGIGLGRTLAAVIEQNNDEHGIIWPMEVAPYKVYILPTLTDDPLISEMAKKMHDELVSNGIDVILDDRNERPGVKFNDADLLGIPLRVTIGRNAKDGLVEFKKRNEKEVSLITYSKAIEEILSKCLI